jgi:serine/threonine-protein kinase RsbW
MEPLPERIELSLENRHAEIARVHSLLDQLALQFGWHPRPAADLHVAIEEHLTNVINHGYAPGQTGRITVRFLPEPDELRVEIQDDAPPFNPLLIPPVDVAHPIDERSVGGLGVHLMRRLTDQLEYERREPWNRLVLRKRLHQEPAT